MEKFAFYSFVFGMLKIGYTDTSVVSVCRAGCVDAPDVHSELSDRVFGQICEYLDGKRKTFDFPYELKGTIFQNKVWEALCAIPYGQTRTYKQIAQAVGNPNAGRAVGMANHNNPIMIVVPCHRVVGVNGALTGYAGGIEMKRALLELEQR